MRVKPDGGHTAGAELLDHEIAGGLLHDALDLADVMPRQDEEVEEPRFSGPSTSILASALLRAPEGRN
jgi:hypothetical protein